MKYLKFIGVWVSAGTVVTASTSLTTPASNAQPAVQIPIPSPSLPIEKTGYTLVEVVNRSTQYKTLAAAIKAADLTGTLAVQGPFTLFAPNDAAFQQLPPGTVEKLLKPENKAALQRVLQYHLLPGTLLSKDLKTGEMATVEGSKVSFKIVGKKLTINNANIIKANVKANNGIAHAIDRVLLPANLKLK